MLAGECVVWYRKTNSHGHTLCHVNRYTLCQVNGRTLCQVNGHTLCQVNERDRPSGGRLLLFIAGAAPRGGRPVVYVAPRGGRPGSQTDMARYTGLHGEVH